MPSFRLAAGFALAWTSLTVPALFAQAPLPSEALFPSTTKGFISAPDPQHLAAQWEKTQIGQLMKDPLMKDFAEDLRGQLQERLTDGNVRLGLTWDDLKDVPSGEVALARVQPAPDKAAVAMVMVVLGRRAQAQQLVNKVKGNLIQQGAKESVQQLQTAKVVRLDLPKQQGDVEQRSAYYLLTNDLLVATDDAQTMAFIAARAAGQAPVEQTLSAVPAFRAVMARCQQDAHGKAPQLRWFVEPFGYFEALKTLNPDRVGLRRKGRSMYDVLKNQGFTAIQGLGGHVDFAAGDFEVLHRTFIFAPPPYTGSMQMLTLPDATEFAPQPWVPKDVANFSTIYFDIRNAFDHFGPFFDDAFGDGEEGVWKEIIDGLKLDPNGPQIDLRQDLFVHLGQRVTMITDYELPITPNSERVLFAIETGNEQKVALAIEKIMKADRTMRMVKHGKHVVWETIPDAALPARKVTVELGGVPSLGPEAGGGPPPARVLPTAVVTVAHGQLMVASHLEFLKKVLDQGDQADAEPLGRRLDFKLVSSTIAGFGVPANCARTFSRTDEEYRATYELLRQNQMPESKTLFGRLLNRILGSGKKGEVRKQQIDGAKLPEYQVVRRYLGPAGSLARSEQSGWFLIGFRLKKQ